MVETIFLAAFVLIFLSIAMAIFLFFAAVVFYILKFTLPLILRLLIYIVFGLSVIRAGNRKSFNGTYTVRYLRWNDEKGRVFSTKDKGMKVKKMYYGFMDGMVYTDFQLELNGDELCSGSVMGKAFSEADCSSFIEGWFTISARGYAKYPNGSDLFFALKMTKINNKVVKKYFRCLNT